MRTSDIGTILPPDLGYTKETTNNTRHFKTRTSGGGSAAKVKIDTDFGSQKGPRAQLVEGYRHERGPGSSSGGGGGGGGGKTSATGGSGKMPGQKRWGGFKKAMKGSFAAGIGAVVGIGATVLGNVGTMSNITRSFGKEQGVGLAGTAIGGSLMGAGLGAFAGLTTKAISGSTGLGATAGILTGLAVGATAVGTGIVEQGFSPFAMKAREKGIGTPSIQTAAAMTVAGTVGGGFIAGAATAGIARAAGTGILGQSIIGGLAGLATAATAAVTGVSHMANIVKSSMQGTIEKGVQRGAQLRGFQNKSRTDVMSTAYLPQSLHRVRHKKVL